jgi:hypothetical protein
VINTIFGLLEKVGLLAWIRRQLFERGVEIKTKKGINVFVLGSNKFMNCPNILVVHDKPLIQVEVSKNRLFLSATILDKDNQIVARINRNKVVVNKDKVFTVENHRNRIRLTKHEGAEYIEFIVHDDGSLEMNGIFYCDGRKITATPEGLIV